MADIRTVAPIGVFDSGLGGLTVVRRIWEVLPAESILFVADQTHVPYGGRDLKEVCGFACGISDALFAHGCKAVVMACNISSATALARVQSEHPKRPTLGVISAGALAAVNQTKNRSIGVMATEGTVRTGAYPDAVHSFRVKFKVTQVACPAFVPLVEANALVGEAAHDAGKEYLAPLLSAHVDTIILGCTHYPFLLPVLQSLAPHVKFVDPAEHTALELADLLKRNHLLNPTGNFDGDPGRSLLTSTGAIETFCAQTALFLPSNRLSTPIAASRWASSGLILPA